MTLRTRLVMMAAGCALVGAILVVKRSREPAVATRAAPSAGTAEGSASDTPAVEKAAPATATLGERERVRASWTQMAQMLEKTRSLKQVVPSSPERRKGETEEFFQERTRALSDYRRFLETAQVSPDRDLALRRAIADAQENWKLALKAAGRTQPLPQGSEMADPVLQPIYITINEDFTRAAKQVLTESQSSILQSFIPGVLPFLRTQAFETR